MNFLIKSPGDSYGDSSRWHGNPGPSARLRSRSVRMFGRAHGSGGAWRPGSAALVTGLVGIGFYVIDLLGAILGLPSWVTDLALTRHLGQPMAGIFDASGIVACAVIAVAGLAIAAVGLRRRDLRG